MKYNWKILVAPLSYLLTNTSTETCHVKELVTVQWLLQLLGHDIGKTVHYLWTLKEFTSGKLLLRNFIYFNVATLWKVQWENCIMKQFHILV